ncbi:HutD family protein [Acinetobacter sp. ANC 4648]|uniref:HutD/Ves family protein n=1 Tax=Acinetobacter sp. ANC 4648 TaxID=1977875 RepID=UPI000A351A5F|nr:HutD family protein [Acinetobacter sp. ANC 4648]OTG81730.1 hypothetical protein B9T27_10730 [Acinetobacter sp. ANC 4648]
MIQVLTQQHYKKMPWKNGLGFTLEVARSHGVGLDDFDWRVSIADVKTAGQFSYFKNKQRILGVLEGQGLTLQIDQIRKVSLEQKQFFAFHGESEVCAELLSGEIRDFNLIYNPQKIAARLQWINSTQVSSVISDAKHILIFNAAKQLDIEIGITTQSLLAYETLNITSVSAQATCLNFNSKDSFDFCLIELFPA